jgi:DNA-binding CsgD family transcriptional regulator
MARTDLLTVLEHAYGPAGDDGAWLREIVAAAADAGLDRGLGACGWFYDVSAGVRVWAPIFLRTPRGAEDALRALEALAPSDIARALRKERPSCATLTARLGVRQRELRALASAVLGPMGVGDFLSVAGDEDGKGCLLGAPMGARTSGPSRREIAAWTRVAVHVTTALRLRREAPPAEAILEAGGRVVHAEGAAIAAQGDLARRARSIDRARGRLRREDPDAALAAWTALHEGRWALVDSFDHDGRRYVLARPIASAAPRSLAVLSDGEREVAVRVARGHADKLVAYELGLAPSTVATRLTSACKKLRVRSRAELVRAVRRAREGAPS